jgi:hypothetical protein
VVRDLALHLPTTVALLDLYRVLIRREYRRLFSSKGADDPGPKAAHTGGDCRGVDLKQRNSSWGCPRIAQLIALAFRHSDQQGRHATHPRRSKTASHQTRVASLGSGQFNRSWGPGARFLATYCAKPGTTTYPDAATTDVVGLVARPQRSPQTRRRRRYGCPQFLQRSRCSQNRGQAKGFDVILPLCGAGVDDEDPGAAGVSFEPQNAFLILAQGS